MVELRLEEEEGVSIEEETKGRMEIKKQGGGRKDGGKETCWQVGICLLVEETYRLRAAAFESFLLMLFLFERSRHFHFCQRHLKRNTLRLPCRPAPPPTTSQHS